MPVEGVQVGGFDREQHAQRLIAKRFYEGVADFVHEQGLAEGRAVGERVELEFGEGGDVERERPLAAQGQESARAGEGGDNRVAAVGFALEGQFEGGEWIHLGPPCGHIADGCVNFSGGVFGADINNKTHQGNSITQEFWPSIACKRWQTLVD